MSRPPRFLVLGAPVPPELADALAGIVDLHDEGDLDVRDADGVLLPDVGDVLPLVRRFREAGVQAPVFGLAERAPDVRARLQWIREGADDLLHLSTAADVLGRRIGGAVSKGVPDPEAGARVDRWLRTLHRYVAAREELVRAMGSGGRARFVDVAFLRDQVTRTTEDGATDPFGGRRGAEREALRWPARTLGEGRPSCEIVNVGPDGLCVALGAAPERDGRFGILVQGSSAAAELDLEVRWHRRTGRERWEAGATAAAVRMLRG